MRTAPGELTTTQLENQCTAVGSGLYLNRHGRALALSLLSGRSRAAGIEVTPVGVHLTQRTATGGFPSAEGLCGRMEWEGRGGVLIRTADDFQDLRAIQIILSTETGNTLANLIHLRAGQLFGKLGEQSLQYLLVLAQYFPMLHYKRR